MSEQGIVRLIVSMGSFGAALLALTIVIPVEGSTHTPWSLAQGYPIGGGMMGGWVVAVVELAPFLLGIVLAVAWSARRSPDFISILLLLYGAVWLGAGVLYLIEIAELPGLRLTPWWIGGAVVLITIFVGLIFAQAKRRGLARSSIDLALILTGGSVVSQAANIVFFLVEDHMLLNVGAVTGEVGAVVVFVSLLMLRQGILLVESAPRGSLCPQCYYDLRGNLDSDRCPECGTRIQRQSA